MIRDSSALHLRLRHPSDPSKGTLTFRTRDGLLSKDEIRTPEHKLLEHIEPGHDDDILVLDANYGVVGIGLARVSSAGETVMTETSARSAETCRTNAARNGADNVTVELTADCGEGRDDFDLVAYAPKPYDPTEVANEKIAKGLSRLQPGGTFYLAGSKQAGVKRYADTLSALGANSERVTVSEGCHLYRAECPSNYELQTFIEEWEFRDTVGDYTCRFVTRPGLFSADSLDKATAELIRQAPIGDGDRVLDCCCGYGAIGAFIGARTDCLLWATDDDAVATRCARQNYERNGVSPEHVWTADCLDGVEDLTFDAVLSNPPTHAGKGVTRKLFTGVHDVLADDGEFLLVANRVMNYPDYLSTEFEFVSEVIAEVENFEVIRGRPD